MSEIAIGTDTAAQRPATECDQDSQVHESSEETFEQPRDEETEAFEREALVADAESVDPTVYPGLKNMSAAFMFSATLRVTDPAPVEYVTLPEGASRRLETVGAVAQWNMVWEAGQYRRRMFEQDDLPEPLASIADRGDHNVVFVPRTRSRYHEYAPLFHLLARATLERFGLPLLRPGQWPHLAELGDVDRYLPRDFETRLSRAWSSRIWRDLWPQSPLSAFSRDDPIRLLAHNLDFWLPPVTTIIQDVLREMPLVDKGATVGPAILEDGSALPGAQVGHPRAGTDVWRGEQEADEMVKFALDEADARGQVRAVLDAVRAHRVEDDFSERWSRTREDFERKLYRKRAKVSVRFVELTDVVPVHGPEAEVLGEMVCADFLTLLDPVDRQVVVLLTSGTTNLGDVADTLGYANHSAVSKRLARIRREASAYFDQT